MQASLNFVFVFYLFHLGLWGENTLFSSLVFVDQKELRGCSEQMTPSFIIGKDRTLSLLAEPFQCVNRVNYLQLKPSKMI